jgi:phenylacetate-CoA ligase
MNAIQLRRAILDAAEHVPFYRRHWKQAGVDLTRVYSATHLEFLPVVTRNDLLNCPPEDRLDRRYLGQHLLGEQTCTESGEAFELPIDKRTQARRRMRFWNALRDVGYRPGERLMLVSDTPMASSAALLRWTHADVALSDDALFEKCMKARPAVLCAPLSALTRLAARVVESREAMGLPRLLVSTSEHLTDAKRALLESTFRAKVADFYSTPELGLVAYSKPSAPGYQLLREEFHVETLHSVGHRGGPERLLVTDLAPGAMPLIRFDTGDFALPDLARSRALAPASILGFTTREPVRVDRKPRQTIAAPGRDRAVTGLGGSRLPDAFAQGSI